MPLHFYIFCMCKQRVNSLVICLAASLLQACATPQPVAKPDKVVPATSMAVEPAAPESKASALEAALTQAEYQILFASDVPEIPPRAEKMLDQIAQKLKVDLQNSAMLIGHTENLGSTELAVAVSEKYVNEVKKALLKRGVKSSQLRMLARGNVKRQVFCTGASCPKKMRRVVILLTENQRR